jgi:TolB-like protein/DNA-binding winged helix-turn-helix (wHTH) protein/tetratricopeptide (TPR) repeat protein
MASEKTVLQDLVLDLTSFQVIRAGQRVKLEKTPMELLALLVRRPGALVTREEIVGAIWGDAVHVDVDAGINTAIRKIRVALDDNADAPRYLETVVGKGYRFVGPITVVNNNVDVLAPPTASTPDSRLGRRTKVALLAAALAIVPLFALFAIHHDMRAVSGDSQGRLVIGVVPLENLSGDPGQDFFVQGLTEEVITQLGQLNPDRIGVMRYGSSYGSSTGMRQTKSMVPDPRPQSGLQYLLEGSVRRQDERARISIRLVRVADETTVWTESFDRNVGDVLVLQSEIARRIGRELQIRVIARANRKPVEPAVVESYLRGRFELARHIMPVPDAARAHFQRAITLDPSYAPTYAGLADFYRSRGVGNDEGAEENWRLAEQYATEALSLDSESAETHAAIAQIKLMHDWDWRAAREHALRALQLNPSLPEAHSVYALYLRVAGNMGEAVSHRKQAVALDPLRVDLQEELVFEYFFARDYKSALAWARQALADDPNHQFARGALCNDLGYLGLFDESVAECGKFLALVGHAEWVPPYVQEYHKHGYEAASLFIARKDLNEILKLPQPDLWGLANAYVLADMPEEALRTLFQGLQIHDPGLLQIRVDPEFDSIRHHPHYAELVRRIGFPTE